MNSTIVFVPSAPTEVSARVWIWQVSTLLSMLFFTSFSALDLGFSALFFDGFGFSAANILLLEIVRQIIWKITVLTALLCLIGAVVGQCGHRLFWVSGRQWTYSALLMFVGPVLIVNEGLKAFWGRARPAEITEFGGSLSFTPALVPTDQCARNCSFASGEGSGAVACAIVVWVLTEHIAQNRLRTWLRLTAIVSAVIGSFLRIATGRHFLSDTVFAALIVTGLALLLRPILSKVR